LWQGTQYVAMVARFCPSAVAQRSAIVNAAASFMIRRPFSLTVQFRAGGKKLEGRSV
jgi:hypothetical protein